MQSSDKPTTFQGVPTETQPNPRPELPHTYTSPLGPSSAARTFPSPPTATALPQRVDPALVESLLQSLRQQDSHQQHQQKFSSRKAAARVRFFRNDYDYGEDSEDDGNKNNKEDDEDDDEYLPSRKIYRGSVVQHTDKQPSAFFSSQPDADSLSLPSYQGGGAQAFFQNNNNNNNNNSGSNSNTSKHLQYYYSQGGAGGGGGFPLSSTLQSTPQKKHLHINKSSSQQEYKEEDEVSDEDSDESNFEASLIKETNNNKKKDKVSPVLVPGDSNAVFMRAPRRKRRARILREGQLTMIVYGADEALLWAKRVFSFQAALRGTLGDRRRNFSWYGSVLDSVVGVFLTQNVADHLSSRAYMEIVSRWPAKDPPPGSTTPFERRDTVDWEAIRTAPPQHLADAIRCRGLMNFLTSKIQAALNVIRARNIHRMHEKWAFEEEEEGVRGVMEHMIDAIPSEGGGAVESRYQALSFHPTELLSLEWMRDLDDASAYQFLSSIDGLGAKSCACVMLLTLNRKEFPVDTNVGRIAARLGWLPLDASQAIEDLDDYAPEQEVHKYLKSRLLGFGFNTLYELHYQMITLGKVFCSKANPNCSSCPMAGDCEYALNNGPRIGGRQRIRARYAADIHNSVAAPVHEQQPLSPLPRQGGKKRGRPRRFDGGYSSETSITTMSTTTMEISSTDIEDIGRDRYDNDDDEYNNNDENGTSIYADEFQALHWKRRQKLETLEQQRLRAQASTLSLDGLMAAVRRRVRSKGLQRAIGTRAAADIVADRERLDSAWKKRYEALLKWRREQAEEEEEEQRKMRSEEKQQQQEERKKNTDTRGHWREKKRVKEEEEEEAQPRVVEEVEENGEGQLLLVEELEEEKEQHLQTEDEELEENEEQQPGPSKVPLPSFSQPPPEEVMVEEEEQQDAECQRLLELGEQLNCIHHAIAVTTADGSASVVLEDKALELALDILNLSAAAAAAAAAAASSSSRSILRGPIPGLIPPSVLQLLMTEAKRQYRAMSKLVHPDKCSHIQADRAMSTLGDALKVFEERASGRGGANGTCPSVIASCPQLVLKESEDKKDTTIATKDDGWSLEKQQHEWVHTRDRLMIKVHTLSPEIQNVLSTGNRRLGTADCPQILLNTEPALFLPIEDLPVLTDANGATRHPPKPSSHQPKNKAEVEGLLFMTCRVALKGRFPLNGTYFQMNEVFVDNSTVVEPLVLPRNLVEKCATSHVHLGLSVHFMVKGMTRESVTGMFSSDYVCFRAFEPSTGVPHPLPSYLCPTKVKNAKSNWKNSSERAAEKLAKLTKQGVITERAAANISVAPPTPPVRYIRPLMGEEMVGKVLRVLRWGESRSRFQFEETYFASQPRYGSALPVMMDGGRGRGRGRGGLGGGDVPPTPGKRGRPPGSVNGQKQKKNAAGTISNDDDNDGGGGRSRIDRFPKMSRSSRCGECHTCLNPQMKKACLTRRAEMGEEMPFVKRRWS